MSSLFVLLGLATLVVAGIGLVRGRVTWARIATRRAAGVALGAALGLLLVGGALAPTAAQGPAAQSTTPAAGTHPAVTAAPHAAATSTRTTPAATAAVRATAAGTTAAAAPARGTALALLATLAVKGRAPKTGYSRDAFGQAWADTNRNGCDTRNDILRRDLTGIVVKPGTGGCLVLSGDLRDPYTATTVHFVRGGASEVDIDHVVALSDAWQTGATPWPPAKRLAFANDPLNLLAVTASANRQKGDSDAASWLPSDKSYRCAYVARQVAVKVKFHLWVTASERGAIAGVLARCTGLVAPTGGNPTLAPFSAPVVRTTSAAPAPTRAAVAPPPAAAATDPQFGTCKAAIAAGYGPYVQGKDPEYDWYRDADHDGIVCER